MLFLIAPLLIQLLVDEPYIRRHFMIKIMGTKTKTVTKSRVYLMLHFLFKHFKFAVYFKIGVVTRVLEKSLISPILSHNVQIILNNINVIFVFKRKVRIKKPIV